MKGRHPIRLASTQHRSCLPAAIVLSGLFHVLLLGIVLPTSEKDYSKKILSLIPLPIEQPAEIPTLQALRRSNEDSRRNDAVAGKELDSDPGTATAAQFARADSLRARFLDRPPQLATLALLSPVQLASANGLQTEPREAIPIIDAARIGGSSSSGRHGSRGISIRIGGLGGRGGVCLPPRTIRIGF